MDDGKLFWNVDQYVPDYTEQRLSNIVFVYFAR